MDFTKHIYNARVVLSSQVQHYRIYTRAIEDSNLFGGGRRQELVHEFVPHDILGWMNMSAMNLMWWVRSHMEEKWIAKLKVNKFTQNMLTIMTFSQSLQVWLIQKNNIILLKIC